MPVESRHFRRLSVSGLENRSPIANLFQTQYLTLSAQYNAVKRPSAPSIDRSSGFAAERPVGWRYRLIAAQNRRRHSAASAPQHGAQQQMRAVSC